MPPFTPFPRRPDSNRSPEADPREGSGKASRESGVLSPGYTKYAGLGIHFAVTMLAFAFGGHWLDGKLGTRPIFLIVGVFAGFTGGLISMIRKVPPATPRAGWTPLPGSTDPADPSPSRSREPVPDPSESKTPEPPS